MTKIREMSPLQTDDDDHDDHVHARDHVDHDHDYQNQDMVSKCSKYVSRLYSWITFKLVCHSVNIKGE